MLSSSAGHTLNAHLASAIPKLLTLANCPEAGPTEAAAREAVAAMAMAVQVGGGIGGDEQGMCLR